MSKVSLMTATMCNRRWRSQLHPSRYQGTASAVASEATKLHTTVGIVGGGPVGLFLSKLLCDYNVPHVLIERRSNQRNHPQAHYINARSMEILRTHAFDDFHDVVQEAAPSFTWRDFVYGHSVTGAEFCRQDHFQDTPADFWAQSPTTVMHLAQNKFESIQLTNIRKHVQLEVPVAESSNAGYHHLYGYNAELVQRSKDGSTLLLQPAAKKGSPTSSKIELICDYVVSAEGAHSAIRDKLKIKMEGHQNLQHLMNVHFSCPGLRATLPTRPAMLYFVFNQAMVAVYVAHDPHKDEWVCQIPYFPPHQQPSDYTESKVLELLRATLFSNQSSIDEPRRQLLLQGIKIHQINNWVMNAQVASSYYDPQYQRVFLAGDSAHRFPPAGGFGMNTGLQDAHNLAWKLAHVVHGTSTAGWLAATYNTERRKIANENTVLSMRNYDKTLAISAALGLDAGMAKVAVQSTDTLLPGFLKKSVFAYAMQTALSTLKGMEDYRYDGGVSNVYASMRIKALQRIIQDKRSLPLIFPQEDIAFSYHNKTVSVSQSLHGFLVGARLPHKWLLLSAGRDKPHCMLSLVDMPHVAYILKSMQSSSSKASQKIAVPPVLVLSSEDQQFVLLEAYRSLPRECQDILVIAVVHRKEKLCDPDGVVEHLVSSPIPSTTNNHHLMLQSQLQVPSFNIDKHTLSPNLIKNKSLKLYSAEKVVEEKQDEVKNIHRSNYTEMSSLLRALSAEKGATPAWQDYVSIVGDVKILRLYDVGESWYSAERAGVVSVRPDGHVHSVLPQNGQLAHVETMARYLHNLTQVLTL